MNIDFQQGIITHPVIDGQQVFLQKNGQYVKLNAANGRIDVAFCHGLENYLHTEDADVENAWGPFDTDTDYWLYWDIHPVTGARSFGHTHVQPTFSNTRPTSPQDGHHWFDTIRKKMYVYTQGDYREVIRVFACKHRNNSFSPIGTGRLGKLFAGTQVGLTGFSVRHGRIFVDGIGKPIKRSDGAFFTTESDFFLNGSPVNSVRLEATVMHAKAAEPMSIYQVAHFVGFRRMRAAQYNDLQTGVIGLVLENVVTDEHFEALAQGIVVHADWNWSAVGVPLWIDDSGQLTETDLHATDPLNHPIAKSPIARVIAEDTILFDQTITSFTPSNTTSTTVTPATVAALGTVRLSTTPVDLTQPVVVGDNDPRMTNARAPTAHTHPASDVTATPSGGYVATTVQGLLAELITKKADASGGTFTGPLILSGDPTLPLGAATKQYVDSHGANQPFINTSGSAYTPVLSDAGKVIRHSNSSAAVINISLNTSVAYASGDVLYVRQVGTGQLTITPAVGVTLNVPTGFAAKTARRGSVISLHYVGSNTWDLTGDFEAL